MSEYRVEHDFKPMVDEIAARIQHRVDQAALDKAADTLAEFGYVKVVRCRDCDYLNTMECPIKRALVYDGIDESACVAPGGFCAWGKRKEGGDD